MKKQVKDFLSNIFPDEFLKEVDRTHKEIRKGSAERLKLFMELFPEDMMLDFSSEKTAIYLNEIKNTFVSGFDRSTIMNCAITVDLELKYEYLKHSKNKARCESIKVGDSITFGKTIKFCKEDKILSVKSVIDRASALNEIRNFVVHPTLIMSVSHDDEVFDSIRQEYFRLLKALGKTDKNFVEQVKNINTVSSSPKVITIHDVFTDPKYRHRDNLILHHFLWAMISSQVIYDLAIISVKLTSSILKGIDKSNSSKASRTEEIGKILDSKPKFLKD